MDQIKEHENSEEYSTHGTVKKFVGLQSKILKARYDLEDVVVGGKIILKHVKH